MEHPHKGWTRDGCTMHLPNSAATTVHTHLIAQPLVHYLCLRGAPSHGPAISDLNLTASLWRNHCMHQDHGPVPCQMQIKHILCLYIHEVASNTPSLHQQIHKLNISQQHTENQEQTAMIHPKRFTQLLRKWQRVRMISRDDEACCTTSQVADKGHCTVYTADGRRFEVPLAYLGTTVFGELLRMSREEFGFTCDGRITLPLDAVAMEYVMCLLRRNASEEVERAFLSSVVRSCHYSSSIMPSVSLRRQLAVCSSSIAGVTSGTRRDISQNPKCG